MAIPAAATAHKARGLMSYMGLEGASAVGAGVGTQLAEDLFPDSPLAQMLAGTVGGFGPIAQDVFIDSSGNVLWEIAKPE